MKLDSTLELSSLNISLKLSHLTSKYVYLFIVRTTEMTKNTAKSKLLTVSTDKLIIKLNSKELNKICGNRK